MTVTDLLSILIYLFPKNVPTFTAHPKQNGFIKIVNAFIIAIGWQQFNDALLTQYTDFTRQVNPIDETNTINWINFTLSISFQNHEK